MGASADASLSLSILGASASISVDVVTLFAVPSGAIVLLTIEGMMSTNPI